MKRSVHSLEGCNYIFVVHLSPLLWQYWSKCECILASVVQLKWKDVETPFESYPYSLAGISQPLGDMGIGWAYVALQGAPFVGEHVRIHELQPGNDLFQLVSEYKALDAIAVIVANSAVDGTVFYNVKRKSEIPVVILTPEHGKKLLEVLRNATDAEVMCTIRPAAISRVPSRKTSRQKGGLLESATIWSH